MKICHNGGKFRIDNVRAFNSLAALLQTNGCTLKLVNGEYEACTKQKKASQFEDIPRNPN